MTNGQQINSGSGQQSLDEVQNQLRSLFAKMQYDIPLYLFTSPGINELYSDGARQIIRAIREVAPRISLREFNLQHDLAVKHNVNFSPTILFDPDIYSIRWLGAPLGEEGRSFVEALIMLGTRQTNINEASKNILSKLDTVRDIKVFISPSCPYCPQQAVNALKAAVERPELISVQLIDIQANPVLADEYEAHSVPQVFANDTLIALGAQSEELFMSSLVKLEQQTVFIPEVDAEQIETDLVIIGGGPAGLTAGIYAARSGLKSVIIEKGLLGGQVATTPVVENYPGFTQVGGKTLVDIMVTHALEYVNIFPGEEVLKIEPGAPINVITSRRRFKANAVLFATGAQHKQLGVVGETSFAGRGVSYCSTCDGTLFKNKKVLVIGGGNSALTDALHLNNIGVEVTLVHRRDSFRAQEHLVANLKAAGIPTLMNHEVQEIRGDGRVQEVLLQDNNSNTRITLTVDGVFIAVGYFPSVQLAIDTGIELTSEGFIKRDDRHRTNIPGIYSAGDVEGGYKQIVTAAGQGSEAALSIFEDLIHPYWIKEKA